MDAGDEPYDGPACRRLGILYPKITQMQVCCFFFLLFLLKTESSTVLGCEMSLSVQVRGESVCKVMQEPLLLWLLALNCSAMPLFNCFGSLGFQCSAGLTVCHWQESDVYSWIWW
jgi:hypothetical protein